MFAAAAAGLVGLHAGERHAPDLGRRDPRDVHSHPAPAGCQRPGGASQRDHRRRSGVRRRGAAPWAVRSGDPRARCYPRPARFAGRPPAAQRRRKIELSGAAVARAGQRRRRRADGHIRRARAADGGDPRRARGRQAVRHHAGFRACGLPQGRRQTERIFVGAIGRGRGAGGNRLSPSRCSSPARLSRRRPISKAPRSRSSPPRFCPPSSA
jgi:hypothetical protein